MITKEFIRRTLSNSIPGALKSGKRCRIRVISLYSIEKAREKDDPNHDLYLEYMRRRWHKERISWIDFLLDHKREILK